jgi:hypothetical protein
MLTMHKNGAGLVQFLIQPFRFFGIEGQNWMLIVFFLVVAFVLYVWRTRDRFDGN